MRLAEALQERADLNRRMDEMRNRLSDNALVQEGEQPAEDPAELLKEMDAMLARFEELSAAINLANCRTLVDGVSLTEMLAKKDALRLRAEFLRDLIRAASQTARRATRSEIKILSTVDVRELQKQADRVSRDLRQLDNRIQETNWTTEL